MALPRAPAEPRGRELARAGFEDLFRAHHARVVRWVRALGVPPMDADDVTQEVFVVAHRRLGTLAAGASVRGWLFSIARRICANHRRGRDRAVARELQADAPGGPIDPELATTRREVARILQRFLDDLPDAQRDVFVLLEIEGMSAPEVAATLGLSPDRVHARVRLAREKLARVIARQRARARSEDHG